MTAEIAETPRPKAAPIDFPVIPWGIFFALLIFLAWPMIEWWKWEYTKKESYYAYAFAVPFLVGIMLWHRRQPFAEAPKKNFWPALVATCLGLALLVIGGKREMQAIMSFAFLLSLISSVWYLVGTVAFKRIAIPLVFLWTMAPLPGPLLNEATQWAQRTSTWGAAKLLALMAQHPNQVGNIIQLEGYTLNVDVPCSGFKTLLTILTLSGAFAYLTDIAILRRWVLFLFSIPLSLFVNSVRIALIGLVGVALGGSAAEAFHDWSGYISLVLCMYLLFGAAKKIGCRTLAGQPIF
jgi:exosortase